MRLSPSLLGVLLILDVTGLEGAHANDRDAQEPGRYALVIGNDSYAYQSALPSAREDAQRVRDVLKQLGFTVTYLSALPSVRSFEDEVLPTFRRQIKAGDLVFFYFSGHGFGYGPDNFLAPADLPLSVERRDLTKAAIAVDNVEEYLAHWQPGLVVLLIDACRSISGFVIADRDENRNLVAKGVSLPNPPAVRGVNTLLAFASRPGQAALGTSERGTLSLFTRRLVEHLGDDGAEFGALFNDVSSEVDTDTADAQQPGLMDWSDTELYLRPSTAILEGQRQAWLAVRDSGRRRNVELFVRRYSVSLYAAAARRWLANDARQPGPAQFSFVSPAAVERAWRPAEGQFAISKSMTGFAYRRSLDVETVQGLQDLADSELGVIPSGSKATAATPEQLRLEIEALQAHGTVLTAKDYWVRAGPSNAAAVVRFLPLGTAVRVTGAVRATPSETWLTAEVPGITAPVYLDARYFREESAPLELGQPLREVIAPARTHGVRDLVDPRPIEEALREFKARSQTITWVSLATGSTRDDAEADARAIRLSDAEYLLRQAGIERRRITSVASAQYLTGGGVRIRFFGY